MKQPLMTLLLASAVFAGGYTAAASDAPPEAAEAKPGTLTTEQVDALVAERPAEDGNIVRFSARFEQVTRLTPAQKISLAGKIPYRVTAEAYLFEANGRRIRRLDGDLHFFILDPEGNVVVTDKRSSKQMCPTWGGRGGYFGEVAKQGEYTVVVWLDDKSDKLLGRKITTSLNPVEGSN